ncbi:TonB-dependent receptor domain-containing protein [Maribellus maritimus]|uniref:TonB-dependent receptor domain-containing protein n=1 Tax=Maribellus maritimus TaxID=2870838 RepID=UPI001EE9C7B3|nr:TonB-dependent receptor [Maribellus maritimus]MCG6189279.1 carboxypeptidase-like regulatory domain-containing protein [Maribellus maritimus]
MKKIFTISSIFIILNLSIHAQEFRPVYINKSFKDTKFEEFVKTIKQQYGIEIFYKPQWIENLRINTTSDSLTLSAILSSALKPSGINFIRRGEKQFFLTGTSDLTGSSLKKNKEKIPAEDDNNDKSVAEKYFKKSSYEKTISKVIIGNRKKGPGSTLSVLSGRISSRKSGEPVIGATVIVDGTTTGAITDGSGSYSFSVETGSNFKLNVSCMGMVSASFYIEMLSSGIFNIEMTEKLIDIQEVVVKSDKHDNIQGLQMGFQRVDMKEIKSIPVVLGERDILKIANMMPGVQTVGEGSVGFNVRGSSADQNLFLINEVPVLNTGHLFGFFSAFNPDMISDFNLYKSNFPVEYGGRLASVFEISTRKGNKKEFGARGGIGPVTGTLLIETPIVKDKASVIVGGRTTYSDWILKKIDDPDISNSDASFYDLMAGVHVLNNERSSLQLFSYYSRDKFTLAQTNDYEYENLGASLIYDRNLNNKWKVKIAAVFSDYTNYHTNREQASTAFERRFDVKSQELKFNFSGYHWLKHRFDFGANAILHNLDQGSYAPFGEESLFATNDFGKENGLEYAFFASDEYSVTDKFTIYLGLRYSLFNYLGPNTIYSYAENQPFEKENIVDTLTYSSGKSIGKYSGPEYRISFNYELNSDMSLKFSYNRMRQYLFMLSNTVSIAPTDRWKLTDPYIKPPVSDQVSLGLYKNFNNASLETSAEIYSKKGYNIVEYKDGADLTSSPDFETLVLQGEQDSYGAEFMIKRNSGRFTGWISYTWSRTKIKIDGNETWQKINNGITYPANYDKPHSFNFVGNIKISRRLNFASNIVFNSGRPVTYPTGIFYVGGNQVISYSNRNEYRIPDYFRIDLSVNVEGNLLKKKFAHSSWAFSVYNLTGRKNAYSVYFKNENGKIKGYKQSIYGVPIFTVSYNFKLGNYAVK